MPFTANNKDRSTSSSNRSSPNPGTATKPNTRSSGSSTIVEMMQDIKDSTDGRKYLEKHILLCPPGETITHTSLSICLHQISAMPGLQKQAINAVRSVAYLLEDMENTQINDTLREALDSHLTELTSDMKTLIEDAKEKIDEHVKMAEERLTNTTAPAASQHRPPVNSYASVLINPPAHANPRVAAREGIKARQFLIEGIKNSKFSHLDTIQLKTELNKILSDLDFSQGKIRSATSARGGGTVIEADNDELAAWLSNETNQRRICDSIGSNAEFRTRIFNIIAFNVPLAINPEASNHKAEICEANNLEPSTISMARWAKAPERRSPNQRTAHLLLSFNNADAANRAITNGLSICNKRCHVERAKREPTRCLKCQGWNHYAKECTAEKDTCGNCAGPHRTSNCLVTDKKCVSCKSDDHASWSRSCPAFLRKLDEFNIRNPDNSLQYFPTDDSWTWTAVNLPSATIVSQPKTSRVQQGKKPQQSKQPRRQYDTNIPNYSTQDTATVRADTTGWGDDPGPSGGRPTAQSSQPSQPTQGTNVGNDNSTSNTIRPEYTTSSNA